MLKNIDKYDITKTINERKYSRNEREKNRKKKNR